MMTSDSSRKAQDYSLSDPTVVSIRCKATLDLGRKLTQELGIDQSVDTLGRWMAHYIAELIQDTEKASAEERPSKMQVCCDAILSLWKHRHMLPDGKRPFEELEPLLRALESLDPEVNIPRYFRLVRAAADNTKENDETKSWLEFIDSLDYSAKILIRYGLTQAAQSSLNRSAEWIDLAEAAGVGESAESPVVRMVSEEDDILKASDPDGEKKKFIADRIQRLEVFAEIATAVAAELRQKFPESPVTKGEP